MLHMEEGRRVMGPKVMLNIRQQSGRFIARELNNVTIETGERLLHEGMPRVVIAGLGRLLQKNVVALGVHGHQAQPAGKRPYRRERAITRNKLYLFSLQIVIDAS